MHDIDPVHVGLLNRHCRGLADPGVRAFRRSTAGFVGTDRAGVGQASYCGSETGSRGCRWTPPSVLEVRELVSELRLADRTRDLLDEVYNHLADQLQIADPDLAESPVQMRRGEYIVHRRPAG
jgi:hypothetical protein